MDSEKFDAAIEAALADEVAKINNQLSMVDVRNMMKIRGTVERFIEQTKTQPERGKDYPGINWGDFNLIAVEKVIPLSGDQYYAVLCEEGQCNQMVQAIYMEVRHRLGLEIDVRIEW